MPEKSADALGRPRSYQERCARLEEEYYRLAALAYQGYCRDLTTPLYVVGRKADGIWVELAVAPEAPDGWELVHGAPLSRAKTTGQNAQTVRMMLKREPLWLCVD